MITILLNKLSSGLQRKAITTCSRWAEMYRVMGKPFPGLWTFDHHPWSKEKHDCETPKIVDQKAAQMGSTEMAINKAFYNIDIKGNNCLYVLPASTPDASDFSSSRFDPALELSTHLNNLFTNTRNVGHKRAGNASLFIRGSRSRSQMKSLPVALLIFDEEDEMPKENVALATERTSGQEISQEIHISTPTIPDKGVNAHFKDSTQDHYFFNCPHCGRTTEFIFPDCLVITTEDYTSNDLFNTHLICKECKHILKHEEKINYLASGKWVSKYPDKITRGFQINQLYSMTEHPWEIAETYLKGQYDTAEEQEFFNSKLGLTHKPKGSSILDEHINKCIKNYVKLTSQYSTFTTIGIDVGKLLHVEVDQWFFEPNISSSDISLLAKAKLLMETKLEHFEQLDDIMQAFQCNFCVIDASPERRKALEFANRFPGHVKLCFYGNGVSGKNIHINATEPIITVDRTSWMDLSLNRIIKNNIQLPKDLSFEYKEQIKIPVRIIKKDQNGNPVGRYLSVKDDHFAHSRTYSEIALPLGTSFARNENIKGIL